MPSSMEDLTEIEARLGVTFRDKTLLQRSVVHRSYLNEYVSFPLMDNERLEFLGDAVIDFVVAGVSLQPLSRDGRRAIDPPSCRIGSYRKPG